VRAVRRPGIVKPTVRDVEARQRIPRGVDRADEAPSGSTGLAIPESYGGSPGVDAVAMCWSPQELSRGWMSLAGAMGGATPSSRSCLSFFGTEEQKRK